MNLEQETLDILKMQGIRANKKLGQNFLINEEIIDEIVSKSEITKDDFVIEIGPGLGSLTKKLIENAKKVVAIELDDRLIDFLKNRFSMYDNFEIIHNDVLKVDLNEVTEGFESVKIVANLPYYITTPIIMKLLEDRLKIKSIIVMVQKEVGERICASHNDKEYGAITVSVNYYSNPKIVIEVPKDNFMPSPEVDSCVIKLDMLEKPSVDVKNEKLFFKLIKCAFSQRRKTINNSLTSIGKTKEEITKILNELNIDGMKRAENLSIEDYANISNKL